MELKLLVSSAIVLGWTASSQPAAIAKDEKSLIWDEGGCATWNANPRPMESIRWSGLCKDGLLHGAGTLEWFSDGQPTEILQATMVQGRATGYTRYQLLKGLVVVQVFEGDYVDGLPHGYGQWRDLRDNVGYAGEFAAGEFNGLGMVQRVDGGMVTGQFRGGASDGFMTEAVPNVRAILGVMKNDKFEGPASVLLPNGARIDATFVDGENRPGSTCRQTPPNGSPYMGTMSVRKEDGLKYCQPSAGVDATSFLRSSAEAINSAAVAHGYPSDASASDPFAYIDRITRDQADRLMARQLEFEPLAERNRGPLPDGCLAATNSDTGKFAIVSLQNNCNEVVNVNICMRIEGEIDTGHQSQQLATGSAVSFEYLNARDARYQYHFRYCRPDRTMVIDNCPASCP